MYDNVHKAYHAICGFVVMHDVQASLHPCICKMLRLL